MKEIEKIIEAHDKVDFGQEKTAIGTVVKIEESSYRRIGARIYVSSNGEWVGGISGGCLEGDALKRAQIAIAKNKSSVVVYDTLDDDSHQIGVGLGCNGRIDVMFTPINPEDPNNPIEFLRQIKQSRAPSVFLQIIGTVKHRDQLFGKMYPENDLPVMVEETGIPAVEIESYIQDVKLQKKSKVVSLKSESGFDFEILIEFIRPKIKLICIGDNYDVNAFVEIASQLGWEVHVFGKKSKLNKQVFDLASSVHSYQDAPETDVDDFTAVILMSHDYKIDMSMLKHFLKIKVPYIGLLGPRKRTLKMRSELIIAKPPIDLEQHANLYSPVGLDIGAESPEEIALAITAEIIAAMRNRKGQFLRKRKGPIHERG